MPLYALPFFSHCLSIFILTFTTLAHAETEQALIHINAEGTSSAKPDQVELVLDFSATQLKVEAAREEVDQHVKVLLKKLKKFELDTSTLDSSQTHVYPQYDYQKKQRQFIGYQVNRNVSFILKRLEQLEDLIKVITESKVSNLTKMQFGLSDSELYQAEALSNAIQNSRAVARLIAEGYDVELGAIHTVRHRTTQNIGANRAMLMQTEMDSRSSSEPTYQQKDLEFKANIDVAFTFE
ncbi:MAG: hypothetical protein ACI9T7_003399 [Oleiphilaceae bacterium]|jgi:uncharacterized protein YggE